MSPLPRSFSAFLAFVIPSLAVGCAPGISVEVLQPAAVALPGDIQKVAIIDRSQAKNVGEGVLGVLEGAVTGEGIGADTEGRQKAMEGAIAVLRASPRFETIVPGISGKAAETGLFDGELSWERAERICKNHGCDAIIALEAFDSDSMVNARPTGSTTTNSKGEVVPEFEASRFTSVMAAWRVYDVKNHVILDDFRGREFSQTWTQTGPGEAGAVASLPMQIFTIGAVGQIAGDAYGRRIAPNYITVRRTYFGGGAPRLKEAKHHVKALDWDGAKELWDKTVASDDPKARGKAYYNLALYYETTGDLNTALEMAKKGAVDLHNGRSRRYAAVLQQRVFEQQELERQLKAAEEAREKAAAEARDKAKAGRPASSGSPTERGGSGSGSPTERDGSGRPPSTGRPPSR